MGTRKGEQKRHHFYHLMPKDGQAGTCVAYGEMTNLHINGTIAAVEYRESLVRTTGELEDTAQRRMVQELLDKHDEDPDPTGEIFFNRLYLEDERKTRGTDTAEMHFDTKLNLWVDGPRLDLDPEITEWVRAEDEAAWLRFNEEEDAKEVIR